MRLVLGTANFGLKYGTENKKLKLIDLKKINRLFKYRKLIFDSAIDYKNSHKIIGKNFKKKKVITKIQHEKWFQNGMGQSYIILVCFVILIFMMT